MKKTLITAAALLSAVLQAPAQVILNFDDSQRGAATSADYFTTWLAENTYAGDGGYFAELMLNPFYDKTVAEAGAASLDLQLMNSRRRVTDNYFGLATWATTAEFDNIVLTDSHGQVLYTDDFSRARDEWNPNGGSWTVADGVLRQTNAGDLGSIDVCYQCTGRDATLELDATKTGGAEGFLIAFSYLDSDNYVWWNIGGWNNTQHAIEQCVDGVKTLLATAPGSIMTGTACHLKVVMENGRVRCYIDDALIHDIALADSHDVYGSAGISADGSSVWVRVANPTAQTQDVVVRLKEADLLSARQEYKQLATTLTPSALRTLNVGTTQQLTLEPALDCALRFAAPTRSLNTLLLAIDELPTGIDHSSLNIDHSSLNIEHLPPHMNVYDLTGRLVANGQWSIANGQWSTVNGQLKPGIYIIGGRKILVR